MNTLFIDWLRWLLSIKEKVTTITSQLLRRLTSKEKEVINLCHKEVANIYGRNLIHKPLGTFEVVKTSLLWVSTLNYINPWILLRWLKGRFMPIDHKLHKP